MHRRWAAGDPDAVVKTVLARPEFAKMAASTDAAPVKSWLVILWEWIVDHVLKPLFGPIGHALGASKDAGTVVGLILIAAALGALGFVVFRLVIAFAPSRRGDLATAGVRALADAATFPDWLGRAREAAARGDYRRAIGALFSAALAALDDASVVEFDPARTPGEYRRLVRRARSGASAPFDELAERFVRATFAEVVPQRADFDAAERALTAFEPLVRA